LSPFPTVDQETILIMFDDLCRESALGGRRGGRCAEKKYFEQSKFLNDGIYHSPLTGMTLALPTRASVRAQSLLSFSQRPPLALPQGKCVSYVAN
jgi:hypothetical protein